MTNSQTQAKDLIMGRADILHRFLQLIDKDRPQDLDPYLENLDGNTEQRPLVDQIVDRIITGDKTLYEKYAQAQQEIGSRNPYSSVDESFTNENYVNALGFFMTRWIQLEAKIRDAVRSKSPRDTRSFTYDISFFVTIMQLSEGIEQELQHIRKLRNNAVHGLNVPSQDELFSAGKIIETILAEIENKERLTEKVETLKDNEAEKP